MKPLDAVHVDGHRDWRKMCPVGESFLRAKFRKVDLVGR